MLHNPEECKKVCHYGRGIMARNAPWAEIIDKAVVQIEALQRDIADQADSAGPMMRRIEALENENRILQRKNDDLVERLAASEQKKPARKPARKAAKKAVKAEAGA